MNIKNLSQQAANEVLNDCAWPWATGGDMEITLDKATAIIANTIEQVVTSQWQPIETAPKGYDIEILGWGKCPDSEIDQVWHCAFQGTGANANWYPVSDGLDPNWVLNLKKWHPIHPPEQGDNS